MEFRYLNKSKTTKKKGRELYGQNIVIRNKLKNKK